MCMVVAQCTVPWKHNTATQTINPFIFIRNKRRFMSSEGFSALENNALIFPLAVLPI